MANAELNNDLIAVVAGYITVCNFDGETGEYLSSTTEFLAVGVGIPENSCTDAPGDHREGFALIRNNDATGWDYIADHRGETVYSTETGEAVYVSSLGDYPENTTTAAPGTPYDTWKGSEWVTDTQKQHAADVSTAEQQKSALLTDARATISIWQTELQLGSISDADKASLILWLAYIKELQAVVSDNAPDISWPTAPAEQAS